MIRPNQQYCEDPVESALFILLLIIIMIIIILQGFGALRMLYLQQI